MAPKFISPVPNQYPITSVFGDARGYRGDGAFHEGLDFATPIGTPVRAIADGVVNAVQATDNGEPAGIFVSIGHTGNESGYQSRYMHLSRALVKLGQSVKRGQVIAYSGATGIARSAPHVHFDIGLSDVRLYPGPKPRIGFGKVHRGYTAVPSEPLVPADYSGVLDRIRAQGLVTYTERSRQNYLQAGGAALAVGMGGWLLYTYVLR